MGGEWKGFNAPVFVVIAIYYFDPVRLLIQIKKSIDPIGNILKPSHLVYMQSPWMSCTTKQYVNMPEFKPPFYSKSK